MANEHADQTIGDYQFTIADHNIEAAYYQGSPIDIADIPDDIYTQIIGIQ